MRMKRVALLTALSCLLSGVVAAPALADAPDARADDGSHVVAETTVGGDPRTVDLTVRSTGVGGYAMVRLILPEDWAAHPDRTWPAVYLLAGETRLQDYRGWSVNTDVRQLADDAGVLVVMPGAGPAGFFSDWWNYGKDIALNQWETFTAVELPQLIDRGYRGNGRRAAAGLSLGGYGAIELAARRPGLFRYAASYSGNLNPTGPTGELLTDAIVTSANLDPEALWGDRRRESARWEAHDPLVNAGGLRGTELYLSAGNGLPGRWTASSRSTSCPARCSWSTCAAARPPRWPSGCAPSASRRRSTSTARARTSGRTGSGSCTRPGPACCRCSRRGRRRDATVLCGHRGILRDRRGLRGRARAEGRSRVGERAHRRRRGGARVRLRRRRDGAADGYLRRTPPPSPSAVRESSPAARCGVW